MILKKWRTCNPRYWEECRFKGAYLLDEDWRQKEGSGNQMEKTWLKYFASAARWVEAVDPSLLHFVCLALEGAVLQRSQGGWKTVFPDQEDSKHFFSSTVRWSMLKQQLLLGLTPSWVGAFLWRGCRFQVLQLINTTEIHAGQFNWGISSNGKGLSGHLSVYLCAVKTRVTQLLTPGKAQIGYGWVKLDY